VEVEDLPAEYEQLTEGYEFPITTYELSPPVISGYLEAVEEPWPFPGLAPPIAIAACAMRTMSESLVLPPGAIHTSQELEFCKPVSAGAVISCHAWVARKSTRGRMQLLVIALEAFDEDKEQVLGGKATVILPD
jgi:acyl dehydratase